MSEITDPVVVEPTPKPSLKQRFANKKTAKRVGITAGVVAVLVWLKRRLNANGSVSADLHVENSDDSNDN